MAIFELAENLSPMLTFFRLPSRFHVNEIKLRTDRRKRPLSSFYFFLRVLFFGWAERMATVSIDTDSGKELVPTTLSETRREFRKAYPPSPEVNFTPLKFRRNNRRGRFYCRVKCSSLYDVCRSTFPNPFTCSGPSVHQLKVCRYIVVRRCILIRYFKTYLKKQADECG